MFPNILNGISEYFLSLFLTMMVGQRMLEVYGIKQDYCTLDFRKAFDVFI